MTYALSENAPASAIALLLKATGSKHKASIEQNASESRNGFAPEDNDVLSKMTPVTVTSVSNNNTKADDNIAMGTERAFKGDQIRDDDRDDNSMREEKQTMENSKNADNNSNHNNDNSNHDNNNGAEQEEGGGGAGLRAIIAALQSQNKTQLAEIRDLNSQLQVFSNMRNEAQKVEKLKMEIFELKQAHEYMNQKYKVAEGEIIKRDESIKEMEKLIENSHNLKSLSRELEEWKHREHQREIRAKELMEELAIRESEIVSLTKDNKQMKNIVEGIQGHIKAKEREADQYLKEKNVAISEMRIYQNRNNTLMNEVREEGRVRELEEQNRKLKIKLKEKEEKIRELEEFIDNNVS